MNQGWIRLYRKIKDNELWLEKRVFSKAEAWLDILMEVQHSEKDQKIVIGMKTLTCKRGQSIKSVRTWAKRWTWSVSKVQRFLKLLRECDMIRHDTGTVGSVITIVNYDTYNPLATDSGTDAERSRYTSDTLPIQDNNGENEKNEENDRKPVPNTLSAMPPRVSDKPVDPEAMKIAEGLAELVRSRRRVAINGRTTKAWGKACQHLCTIERVSYERQERVLEAYAEHFGDTYWPVVRSGDKWRKRFLDVEDAMEREYQRAQKQKPTWQQWEDENERTEQHETDSERDTDDP